MCREPHPAQLRRGRRRSRRAVGAGSPIARRILRSIARARFDSIIWPQIARSTACATVAVEVAEGHELRIGGADQRIVPKPARRIGRVRVEGEAEPQELEPLLVGRPQAKKSVVALPRWVQSSAGERGA